jgi:MFS family permease
MFKRLFPAYLLTFVNVLGFSILLPVLPFVVDDYGAPKWIYGLLLTFYSAFQFIGAPFLGALSDRMGRKPVLIISQAGTLLSWIVFLIALQLPAFPIFGIALPLWIIGFSRVLDGITGGNTSVANAYVSDITTREEKSYIFGYLGGIFGIGMIIGPGIGGATASSKWGFSSTMVAAIIISVLALLTLIFLLKESLPKEKRAPKIRDGFWNSFLIIKRIRELEPSAFIKTIFWMKLLFSTMMAFYIATISLFMIDLFHFNAKELGFFMLGVGIFLAFNQALVSKQFIKRFGESNTLFIGLSFCVIGLVSITLTSNLYIYFVCYYFLNLGLSLCFPTFNALISVHGNPNKLGELMGVSESISSLTLAIFPMIAAGLYMILGSQIYYFVTILPVTAIIIGLFYFKNLAKTT